MTKLFEITERTYENLETGGDCNIFDVMWEFRRATVQHYPAFTERVLLRMEPDFMAKIPS